MARTGATALVFLLLLCMAPAQAEVKGHAVTYTLGNKSFIGYLAYDQGLKGKRPGVLVIHEWWGLNDYAKRRARQLAALGYVAFAADMYGQGRNTKVRKQAAAWAKQVRGTPLMRSRAAAALEVLIGQPQVDRSRLAAIGFCFGGTGVLELAYSGADLAGVVTFHGGLTVPSAQDLARLKARILILHGAEDPFVKPATIASLQKALGQGKVDWQMVYYGGAVHAFSNPAAGGDKSRGAAYHAASAERSWRYMKMFFKEIFKP